MYASQYSAKNQKLPQLRTRQNTAQVTTAKKKILDKPRTRVSTEPWTNVELQNEGQGELREFFRQARNRKLGLQNQLELEYTQLMKQKHGDSWTLDSHKALSSTSNKTKPRTSLTKGGISNDSETGLTSNASSLRDYSIHKTSNLYIKLEEPKLVETVEFINRIPLKSSAPIKLDPIKQNTPSKPDLIKPKNEQNAQVLMDAVASAKSVHVKPITTQKKNVIDLDKPSDDKNATVPLRNRSNPDTPNINPIVIEPKGFLAKLMSRKSKNQIPEQEEITKTHVIPPVVESSLNEVQKIIANSKSYADKQVKPTPNENPTCPSCHRHFSNDRLPLHLSICEKSKARVPFDMKKKRAGKLQSDTYKDKSQKKAFNK